MLASFCSLWERFVIANRGMGDHRVPIFLKHAVNDVPVGSDQTSMFDTVSKKGTRYSP